MILYFSGTGNSRYAALRLGELTGELVNSINQCLKEGAAIGLHSKNHYVVVSPVYAWRLPRVVERFIRQASFSGNTGIYFVLTCGDDVGNAAKYARRLCAKKGLRGLRPLCEALSAEQYPPGGWKACLGKEMHPVYGLHLRVPGPGRGVWKADSGEGAVLSDGGWDVGRSGGREGVAHRRPATGG